MTRDSQFHPYALTARGSMDKIPESSSRIHKEVSPKRHTFELGITLLTAASLSGHHSDKLPHPSYYIICPACTYSKFAKLFEQSLQKSLFAKNLDSLKFTVYDIQCMAAKRKCTHQNDTLIPKRQLCGLRKGRGPVKL